MADVIDWTLILTCCCFPVSVSVKVAVNTCFPSVSFCASVKLAGTTTLKLTRPVAVVLAVIVDDPI